MCASSEIVHMAATEDKMRASWRDTLSALTEDLGSVLITLIGQLTAAYNSVPSGLRGLLACDSCKTSMHTQRHKIKNLKYDGA